MYLALQIGRLLVWALPYEWLYQLAGLVGVMQFHMASRRRAVVMCNQRQVLGPAASQARVTATTRQVFRHAARNYLDVLTIGSQSLQAINERIDMEGFERLQAVIDDGRGAILVAPHMGNMDLLVQYLVVRHVPVTIPVEHMKPEFLFRLLQRLRGSHGIRLLPLGGEIVHDLLDCLRRGEIVGFLVDRDLAGSAMDVSFFGRPARLPIGPCLLALRSGAPLVGVYAEREPSGRSRGHVTRALHVQKKGRLQESLVEAVKEMAALIEEPIRLHPDQWTIFAPIWECAGTQARSAQ